MGPFARSATSVRWEFVGMVMGMRAIIRTARRASFRAGACICVS